MMAAEAKNIDKLISKLENLKNIDLDEVLNKACILVENDAKKKCPVDKGQLRNSITHEVEGKEAVVGTNTEYAPYVEFGTGIKGENSPSPPKANVGQGYRSDWVGQVAQPFLYPALANNKDKVLKQVRPDLIKEIGRLCSK